MQERCITKRELKRKGIFQEFCEYTDADTCYLNECGDDEEFEIDYRTRSRFSLL